MPQLGGKYVHRAYGAGRYVDKGLAAVTIEERITAYSVAVAGVTTELEVAPFAGIGAVFSSPGRAAARYARPVFGAAVRAVARPQVVGSSTTRSKEAHEQDDARARRRRDRFSG